MIIDRIENLSKYIPALPQLKEVVSIIESGALSVLPLGGYPGTDPSLRYSIMRYESEMVEEKPYEIHHRDADVQILLAGRERMDIGDSESFVPTGEYNTERDIVFGSGRKIAAYHADPLLCTALPVLFDEREGTHRVALPNSLKERAHIAMQGGARHLIAEFPLRSAMEEDGVVGDQGFPQ